MLQTSQVIDLLNIGHIHEYSEGMGIEISDQDAKNILTDIRKIHAPNFEQIADCIESYALGHKLIMSDSD